MPLDWKSSWVAFGAFTVLFTMAPAAAQEPVPTPSPSQLDTDGQQPLEETLEGTPALPSLIRLPLEDDRPIFIRGDLVVLDSGRVHPHTPLRASAQSMEWRLKEFDRLGCTPWYHSALDQAPLDQKNLSDGLERAAVVVLGTVTGRLQGFRDTLPGTAVRFDIDEVLKGRVVGTERFFFFPISDFQAGPYHVCIDSESYPPLPDLGSQILVLLREGPYIEGPFWGQGATSVVTFAQGLAMLPTHFRKAETHVLDQQELLHRVRAELESLR